MVRESNYLILNGDVAFGGASFSLEYIFAAASFVIQEDAIHL